MEKEVEKGIKLDKTKLRNFAGFQGVEVSFNGDVSYICGDNGAGKSTLTITALQALFKGIGENDTGDNIIGSRFKFIGPYDKSADITLRFHDEKLDRFFSFTRHLTAGTNGELKIKPEDELPIPPEWLSDFLNVSLMSSKHFSHLSGKEQALALGINTDQFDQRIEELKAEFTILNRELTKMGEIKPVDKVDPVNIDELIKKKDKKSAELNTLYLKNRADNKALRDKYYEEKETHRAAVDKIKDANREKESVITECESALTVFVLHGYKGKEAKDFVENLPQPIPTHEFDKAEPEYIEEVPSRKPLDDIEAEILQANKTNRLAGEYQRYLKAVADKESKQAEIAVNAKKQDTEKQARIDYIKQFNFGFAGLTTNDKGELEFNGKPVREPFVSTGQLIMIVAKLMRSKNPIFKTVFLDNYSDLDPKNGPKILKELTDEGFSVIVSIPSEKPIEGEHCIVLRECKLLNEDGEKEKLL